MDRLKLWLRNVFGWRARDIGGSKDSTEVTFSTVTQYRDVWLNSDLSLFCMDDKGELKYLSCAGVFRVMQRRDGWHVILYGYLPLRLNLFQGGTTFEVYDIPCSSPGNYREGTCVMRFSGCEITRKWIKHPVVLSSNDTDVVRGYIEMSCELWMLGMEAVEPTIT